MTLSFVQSLHLAALFPCVIVTFYLLYKARQKELVVVPTLYFLSLICGILNSLLPAFVNFPTDRKLSLFHLKKTFTFLLKVNFHFSTESKLSLFHWKSTFSVSLKVNFHFSTESQLSLYNLKSTGFGQVSWKLFIRNFNKATKCTSWYSTFI